VLALSFLGVPRSTNSEVAAVWAGWLLLRVLAFSSGLSKGSQADFCLSGKGRPGTPNTRCPSCGKVRCVAGLPGGEECPSSLDIQEKTTRIQREARRAAPHCRGPASLRCPQSAAGCNQALEDQGQESVEAPGSGESCWQNEGLERRCRNKEEEK